MAKTTTKTPPIDFNTRVTQYITLRDKIKAMDEDHKEAMKPYRATLEQLGGILLSHLKSINANTTSSDNGTVYRTVKQSASIADGELFWSYVKDNEAWDLLDKRANVVAVADYIEEHKSTPPGINYTTMESIGVRRK